MGSPNVDFNRSTKKAKVWLRVLASFCYMMTQLSGGLPGGAGAAEWSAMPSLTVKGVYNSNLLLANGNNEVWGDFVSPGLKFKGATESFQIEGNTNGDFVHYYGEQDRSYTNLFFPVHASYRWARLTFGFDGGYTRDNTLRSELLQTGVVLNFTQRNLWTANPSLTFGLTDRLNWQVGYQFTDASYQNGLSLGLVNYQVNSGLSKLSYNLGERTQVKVTGDLVNYQAPDIDQTWTYYGGGMGLSHNLSKSLIATISGAVRFINTTQGISSGSLNQNDTVWVYNASIAKEFERSQISVEASREINPSGFGRLLETTRISGMLSYNLTEQLTASITGGMYIASSIASVGTSFPRSRYSNINPALSWRFAEWWTFEVGYSYSERVIASTDQWNFANSTFIMLTYGGPKWSVSR